MSTSAQSPGRFQQLNRVIVNFLNLHNHPCFLYLDDRIMVFNFPNIVIRKNKTFLGAALMAIMLVGFGGYVNCEKSTFGPVRQIDFLGFDIDSVK